MSTDLCNKFRCNMRHLICADHVHILGGQNIIHTVLAIQLILECSTSSFGSFFRNGRLIQATHAFSTGVLWKEAQLRELRRGTLAEQLAIGRQDLPFRAKIEVITTSHCPWNSKCSFFQVRTVREQRGSNNEQIVLALVGNTSEQYWNGCKSTHSEDLRWRKSQNRCCTKA